MSTCSEGVIAVCQHAIIYTVYPKILAVIDFGDLPEIWPNALVAEFKFGSLTE